MEKQVLEELERELEADKVEFNDFEDLEEMVTPCGGGCECSGFSC